jgi:predicted small secreted protein
MRGLTKVDSRANGECTEVRRNAIQMGPGNAFKERMNIKKFRLMTLFAALSISITATAQTAKDEIKGAGQDVKTAGKATGSAAKKTGSATKKTVKKGVNKTAEKTAEGANKVEQKTR